MSVKRKNLAGGVVNGIFYAVGGDNDFSYFATNEAYDAATDTWTIKAPMPTPRSGLTAGVVSGILYAVGGAFPAALTTVEAYDPATNTWTTTASTLQARYVAAAAGVNGILYVMGGLTNIGGVNVYLASVEAYNPVTNTWTPKAPMPTARANLATVVVNGIIYAVGGWNGTALATVEAYNPTTDTWTSAPSMPTARRAVAAGEVNGVLYAVGGVIGSNTTLATVEAFTPVISGPPGPSGSQVWNTFLGTLSSTYTASTWILDTAITMTRIQAQAVIPPSGCTVNAVLTVSDGTAGGTRTLTITGAANDSGPIAVSYAAGATLTLRVSTAASCFGSAGPPATPGGAPSLVNALVQYKAQ
jgi:hypothetical protein